MTDQLGLFPQGLARSQLARLTGSPVAMTTNRIFAHPVGFEDDTEVLNGCLRLAGPDELCLAPEDYGDA